MKLIVVCLLVCLLTSVMSQSDEEVRLLRERYQELLSDAGVGDEKDFKKQLSKIIDLANQERGTGGPYSQIVCTAIAAMIDRGTVLPSSMEACETEREPFFKIMPNRTDFVSATGNTFSLQYMTTTNDGTKYRCKGLRMTVIVDKNEVSFVTKAGSSCSIMIPITHW